MFHLISSKLSTERTEWMDDGRLYWIADWIQRWMNDFPFGFMVFFLYITFAPWSRNCSKSIKFQRTIQLFLSSSSATIPFHSSYPLQLLVGSSRRTWKLKSSYVTVHNWTTLKTLRILKVRPCPFLWWLYTFDCHWINMRYHKQARTVRKISPSLGWDGTGRESECNKIVNISRKNWLHFYDSFGKHLDGWNCNSR